MACLFCWVFYSLPKDEDTPGYTGRQARSCLTMLKALPQSGLREAGVAKEHREICTVHSSVIVYLAVALRRLAFLRAA